MLVDATHKRWIIGGFLAAVAALVIYAWSAHSSAGELTGGSTVGLWYGVVGSLLMVYAGLLAAHRKLLRWPGIPGRSWWLKGHIWLGLLSVVFILCHSGFRWGGAVEVILWLLLILTLATGVFGVMLQQFLPRLLADHVPEETSYDQIPHVAGVLQAQADLVMDGIAGGDDERLVRSFYEGTVRPFLGGSASHLVHRDQAELAFARLRETPALVSVRQQLAELERLCDERRRLYFQEQVHRWLHGWLLVHVPLSAALLVVGAAHVIGSLYY